MPSPPHRKRVKHPHIPGAARELTFSCYQRLPLLTADERFAVLLAESIDAAIEKQAFDLLGFVFMPEHVHLLVLAKHPEASISRLLSACKRPHSYRVKRLMVAETSPWLDRLFVQERPGKTSFRFWLEGSGYDRAIVDPAYVRRAIDYFHANPVRRKLCGTPEDWRWSSWHHYHGGNTAGLPRVSGIDRL